MKNEERELNIRKIVIVISIILLIIACILIVSFYIADENFRKWADIKILQKDITTEDVATVDLDTDKNNQIYCYDQYIGIINDKILKLYNSYGTELLEISVNINKALFASNNQYLAIAEKNGQEFCIISGKTYLWGDKIDGEILQICINPNGYVAVVTTDTTYKSIITLYDSTGKPILKNYLSSTRATDVTISNDNQYVAFAEIDTSGTIIKSNIKIISVEKAQNNPEESIIYINENATSSMIVNIEYQEKNNLICVYDDSIKIIKDQTETQLISIDENMTFIAGNLNNSIAYIKEEQEGLFSSNSVLYLQNTSNQQSHTYCFDEIAKEMYVYQNTVGINTGTEIYFISNNGILIKKYTSNQEITNVVLSNKLAIIIYNDEIEIINL